MALERDPHKLFPHDHLFRWIFIPLVPQWLKPNAITVFRMLGTPVVLWLLLIERYDFGVPAFLFLAFTDALDGSLARVRKQITPWGTFYDPVADKLLIGSVILLIVVRHMNPWVGVIILVLEVLILIGGYVHRRRGHAVSANVFGKTKMFLQVLAVMFLLVSVWSGIDLLHDASIGTFALAVVFAVLSLFTYGL